MSDVAMLLSHAVRKEGADTWGLAVPAEAGADRSRLLVVTRRSGPLAASATTTDGGFVEAPDTVILAAVQAAEPGLDRVVAQAAVKQAAPSVPQRRRLAAALMQEPDVLTTGRPVGTLQIERLTCALVNSGARRREDGYPIAFLLELDLGIEDDLLRLTRPRRWLRDATGVVPRQVELPAVAHLILDSGMNFVGSARKCSKTRLGNWPDSRRAGSW